jgi:hypothetical protein
MNPRSAPCVFTGRLLPEGMAARENGLYRVAFIGVSHHPSLKKPKRAGERFPRIPRVFGLARKRAGRRRGAKRSRTAVWGCGGVGDSSMPLT